MSTTTAKTIELNIKKEQIDEAPRLTLLENKDASGWVEKRGGDLLRTDDATFLPAFGKYVRDIARHNPNATMTFKVI